MWSRPLCCASYAGIYFCCNMILVAVTSVVSVVIVHISNRDQQRPVPRWARKVCNFVPTGNPLLPHVCNINIGVSADLEVTLFGETDLTWTKTDLKST